MDTQRLLKNLVSVRITSIIYTRKIINAQKTQILLKECSIMFMPR